MLQITNRPAQDKGDILNVDTPWHDFQGDSVSRERHGHDSANHDIRAAGGDVRYFLDAEFNGFCGDLVSLALAPEDDSAPPFYEAIVCLAPEPWVAAHVIPVLRTRPRPRREVAEAFADFLAADGDPLIVADWPEDIANAARLLVIGPGQMLGVPRLRFELVDFFDFNSAAASTLPHNAYHDALALRLHVLERER